MQTEFEVKVLDIDVGNVKSSLHKLGFDTSQTLLFRRYVYLIDNNPGTWLRLRTDGKVTTLTLKNYKKDSIDGVGELEVDVGNFDATHQMIVALGYKLKNYQENKRTLFVNNEVEIAIDEWPLIKPYMEIEAKSEILVQKYIELLRVQKAKKTSQPTSYVYEMSGLNIDDYPRLTFRDHTD